MFEQQAKLRFKQIVTQLKSHIITSNLLFTIIPMTVNHFLYKQTPEYNIYFKGENPLSYGIHYDATYFMYNSYQCINDYAFLPGLFFVKQIYKYIINYFVSDGLTILVALLMLTNKILNVVSCYNLYHIVIHMTQSKKIAEITTIVFIYNPASIFYHVVYTESMYCCLTFYAIRLYLDKQKESSQLITSPLQYVRHNLKSLLVFTCASTLRTTGLFLSLLYGLPILIQLYRNITQLNFNKAFKTIITGALTLSFFVVFFIGYLYYAYRIFCIEPPHAPFCSNRIPNIYSFIEQQYWKVGFLKYYFDKSNILQICLGLPSILASLITFSVKPWKQNAGLTLAYWVLLYITIFYANVQSSARFLSTHPIYLINIAQFLVIKDSKLTFCQFLIFVYLCAYNSMGVVFFPLRFSWT